MKMVNRSLVAGNHELLAPDVEVSLLSISPNELRVAPEAKLKQLQKLVGMGDNWGVLRIDDEHQSGLRTSDLDLRLYSGRGKTCKGKHSPFVVRELMRLAITMAIIPGKTGKVYRYTTIRTLIANLKRAIQRTNVRPSSKRLWSLVERAGLTQKYSDCLGVVEYYHRLGCLPDGPAPMRPTVHGMKAARDRTGEPEHTIPVSIAKPHQPYSDEFVSEAGSMALVMIEVVGPTLLDAVEAALAATETTRDLKDGPSPSPSRRAARVSNAVIRSWEWRGPDGEPLRDAPLQFSMKSGRSGKTVAWPPRTLPQALRLIVVLQGAHAFPVALSGGPRHGELLTMQIGSLGKRGGSSVYEFRTWKFENPGGRQSEAPAPSIAIQAILQQERLANIFRRHHGLKGNGLWVSPRYPDKVPSLAHVFNSFVEILGLERWLTDGGMNPHRFRKTLARIVALALVHAPKILMDVFGHRDEQMTIMRYILSDPGILSEVQQVVREMLILKGVEAINKADEVQGAGAEKLRGRVALFARRLGKSALDPQNIREFARAMTAEGSSWAVVAPGIVCTNFTDGGLCNKGHGQANPHYCHPACENQLILPDDEDKASRSVVQAIETVQYNLELLEHAFVDDDVMLIAQFRGQIKSVLGRWKKVDEYFSKSSLLTRLVPNVVLLK